MMPQISHGFYSEKAHKQHGAHIYLDDSRREVRVTAVAEKRDYMNEYKWDDTKYVGLVVSWVQKIN